MPLHQIRNTCLFGLPLLLITASLFHFLPLDTQLISTRWSEYFYIVALTANIGYFTNYVAIKMLFKPHQPTAFGRQGLIPKNQPKLAAALSATLSKHFLASDHWHEYLEKADLNSKLMNAVESYCQNWAQDPQNADKINQLLAEFISANKAPINRVLDELQHQLITQLTDSIEPEALLKESFTWIEKQFAERPGQMEFLIEPVIKTIAGNVPMIASHLVKTVDRHIENQDTIRRSVAKAARWSANITEDDVKDYLFSMVASAEFRRTLFEGIETLFQTYKNRTPETYAVSHYENVSHQNSEYSRTKHTNVVSSQFENINFKKIIQDFIHEKVAAIDILELACQSLLKPLNSRVISNLLADLSPSLFQWLKSQMARPEVNKRINQQLVKLIEHLDLRDIIKEKASQFSPRKMESIFHSMISDQLVFIELLGALLGALSGIALINLKAFILLALTAGSFYGADIILTRIKHRRQINLSLGEADVNKF
ncbi:DUF445 domain-containing protein [Aliikangiella coralliicola]|uniref:DUF445 family protein n=1 Tax=Aliikangiella coralliicola TaxID=2592383 RepID=A0A545UFH0_9GAMM|nr:DUF445 family protein [Aliikangiella coralliicola]TQV88195.1 DUF445 family protein [Aliikangiella coralliicola]